MKNALTILLLLLGMTAQGVTVPKGEERLRELAVVPTFTTTFGVYFWLETFLEDLTEEGTREDWIQRARKKLKSEPNDLQTQLQLGRLLTADDDINSAKVAYEKAAVLGRQRLDQRPHDGINLTLLARAVWGLDNKAEAESLYRRATLVASNDWHCWLGLGEFLSDQAGSNLGTNISINSRYDYTNNQYQHKTLPDDRQPALVPSSEELDQAIKLCREASICFQRAYEIAPGEFEVLIRRGQYKSYSNWLVGVIQEYRTETLPSVEDRALNDFSMYFSPIGRQDYEEALSVRPQSYKLVTLMAWFEWVSAIKEVRRSGNSRPPTLEELPEKSQLRIVGYFQRLKALSDEPDKKVASAALTSMCMLKLQFGESQGLVSELQRAVKFDPTNEQAWNSLIGLAASEVTPEKLTELCERRLKLKENAFNHLILAKAMYKQKRFKEAAKQTDVAIKLEPKYVPAHLMRGAIVIRLYKGERDKKELYSTFTKTGELIKRSTNPESREWWLVFALNTVIAATLDDNSEIGKAWLELCKKQFPDDARVKEIQDALP